MKRTIAAIMATVGLSLFGVAQASAVSQEFTPPDISEFCWAIYETQENPDYQEAIPEESHDDYNWTVEYRYDIKDGISGYNWSDWTPNAGQFPQVADTLSAHEDSEPSTPEDIKQAFPPVQQGNPGATDIQFRLVAAGTTKHVTQEAVPAIGEPTIEVQVGEECDVWVTWAAPGYYPNATGADSVGWDQVFVGLGQIAPQTCATTHQQDRYVGSRDDIEAVLADGILTGPNPPEDSNIVEEWKFAHSDKCVITVEFPAGTPPTCEAPGALPALPANTDKVVFSWDEDGLTMRATPVNPGVNVVGNPTFTYEAPAEALGYQSIDPELPCYEEPPVEEPPVEEPPVKTPPTKLAETGADEDRNSGIATAAAGLGLLGTALLAIVAWRGRRQFATASK